MRRFIAGRLIARHFIAGHGNQRNLQPLDGRQQLQNFFCLAARRKCEHQIAAHDHPEIAVQRLHRMQVQCRRASRTQCRRDLSRNESAFAHPGHNHAAAAVEHEIQCAVEVGCHHARKAISQRPQSLSLDPHYVFAHMLHEGGMLAGEETSGHRVAG